MKKNILLCLFFAISSFYACNDNSEELSFPVTLYPENISYSSDIRLFTGGKEIFDKEIINRFVEGREYFNLSSIDDNFIEEITFLSKDSVKIFMRMINANDQVILNNYVGYSVEKHDQQFIFYSDQAYISRFDVIIPNMNIAYGNYTGLDFSYWAYGIDRYHEPVDDFVCLSYRSGIVPVVFHEAIIPTIAKNDTLAIQEYRVKYKTK